MIAILGFGKDCSDSNLQLTAEIISFLPGSIPIACGGFSGTFSVAFQTNHKKGGINYLFIEKNRPFDNESYLHQICFVESTIEKHLSIAQNAQLGIAIGGGKGTESIVEKLIEKGKPVYVLMGTSGISENVPEGAKLVSKEVLKSKLQALF